MVLGKKKTSTKKSGVSAEVRALLEALRIFVNKNSGHPGDMANNLVRFIDEVLDGTRSFGRTTTTDEDNCP